MDDTRIGTTIRTLRQRRGWRQVDLASKASVSQSAISNMERGRVDRYTLATIRAVLKALDATATLDVMWGGRGDLDRMLDADHARLLEEWARRHRATGWQVANEVSFSIYGERGRVDQLCFHAATGVLEVVEAKTGIWSLEATIGRHDVKIRLARQIAADRGWRATRIVGCLVIAEGRTARRRVSDHPGLFARYAGRGREVLEFIRDPTRPTTGLLAFVALPPTNGRGLRRAGQRRVRLARPESSSSPLRIGR